LRTDGGPADPKALVPTGRNTPYGGRQQLEQIAAARQPAEPSGGNAPPPAAPTGPPPDVPPTLAQGAFGPTTRPNEPITAGAPYPGGAQQLDADSLVRILFDISGGDPWIARLMRD